MKMGDLLIKGGRIIDPAQGLDEQADLLIEKGRVKAIGKNLEETGQAVLYADGLVVTPGFIDLHVHLRDPGQEWKEDIASGTMAAAAGGVTSVCAMPNTNPVVDNHTVVEYILRKAEREGKVNVFPIGAITKGQKGEELAEIGDMARAGIKAISDDGKPVANAEIMRLALQYAGMFNLPVISHAEDPNLAADGVMNLGPVATILGLRGIPAAAEEVMVARDLILAEMTGARLHVAHVSTAGAVNLIRQAKKRGVRVTAEATPHHFSLTEAAVRESGYDTNTKVNPPLRSQRDLEAVIEGLKDGTIDAIATDHAPHHRDDKEVEYNYAAFGISGLETLLPLVLTKLVAPGHLTLAQAVALLTSGPAKVLGLDRGTLSPGSWGDVTVFDPEAVIIVRARDFYSKGKNTPFDGWQLQGKIVATVVGGEVVYRTREVDIGGGFSRS